MMNMCLKKQNYGTSEHADNAQLAVLCKTTEGEEQGRGEVALLCHFQIHNSELHNKILTSFSSPNVLIPRSKCMYSALMKNDI
jgi:hypothetical protein